MFKESRRNIVVRNDRTVYVYIKAEDDNSNNMVNISGQVIKFPGIAIFYGFNGSCCRRPR